MNHEPPPPQHQMGAVSCAVTHTLRCPAPCVSDGRPTTQGSRGSPPPPMSASGAGPGPTLLLYEFRNSHRTTLYSRLTDGGAIRNHVLPHLLRRLSPLRLQLRKTASGDEVLLYQPF